MTDWLSVKIFFSSLFLVAMIMTKKLAIECECRVFYAHIRKSTGFLEKWDKYISIYCALVKHTILKTIILDKDCEF